MAKLTDACALLLLCTPEETFKHGTAVAAGVNYGVENSVENLSCTAEVKQVNLCLCLVCLMQ